jgi:hypothetical protein
MKYFILLITLLLGSYNFLYAQYTPKYSNEFLNIGISARALAMGNTQTAIVQDVTAGYWNPAGLLHIKKQYEVSLMHAELFQGIAQFDYAAFATPVDSVSHIGISAVRLGVDNIPDTRFLYDANGNIDYDRIRFFGAADYAFLFSYARKVKFLQGLRIGANIKVIYRNVGDFANAFGFGLDAGAQLQRGRWHFGLMFKDITGTFNAWTHNQTLIYDIYTQTGNLLAKNTVEITLPRLLLGVGREFKLRENIGLLASLDLNITTDGRRNVLIQSDRISIDPTAGIELDYARLVFLRLGVNNLQQIKNALDESQYWKAQFNFGLGFQVKNITVDYALTRNNTDQQANTVYSHIFSLKASFDKVKLK